MNVTDPGSGFADFIFCVYSEVTFEDVLHASLGVGPDHKRGHLSPLTFQKSYVDKWIIEMNQTVKQGYMGKMRRTVQ
jgi:hypothetical protein